MGRSSQCLYIIDIEWYKSYDIVPLVQRFQQATYKHTYGVMAVTPWQMLLRVELRAQISVNR